MEYKASGIGIKRISDGRTYSYWGKADADDSGQRLPGLQLG